MISRNDRDPGAAPDAQDLEPRQRSARTDPDMRDGDSGRGNPLESGPEAVTTDNDVGDTRPAEVAGDDPGYLPEMSAQLDRSREEVVEAGGVELHSSQATLEAPEATADEAEDGPEEPGPVERGDSGLPLPGYPNLTVPEIIRHAGTLPHAELRALRDYEKSHRRRKTLLTKLERMLRGTGP